MSDQRIRIYQQGAPSVLTYEPLPAPLPSPAKGQVLLRQDAVGINFVDTMFRDGSFTVSLPFDMGVEAAGVVEAVGPGVADFAAGDRAAYFFVPGAYASARLIDAAALVKLPADVTTLQAAGMLSKGLTAWMAVFGAHAVSPGQVVYVNGASGGVGLLVAQWAQSLGATVIAAVGSPEKIHMARQQGLEHVVASNSASFESDVQAHTDGKEIDVVYEFVGRATFEQSLKLLRPGGRLVHIGNASGPVEVSGSAMATRKIDYLRPSTPQYVNSPQSLDRASKALFQAMRQGVFGKPEIGRYPLAEAVRAHEDIAARRHRQFSVLIP
jgi:NADPH2:quinone reductase